MLTTEVPAHLRAQSPPRALPPFSVTPLLLPTILRTNRESIFRWSGGFNSMAEWRSLPATKTVLAEQALKLGEDMKKARQEEKLLAEQEKPQVVTFELPDAGGEKVTALRAIVAARAFKGALLEGKDPCTVSVPQAAEGEEAAPAGDANVISVKGVSKATMELAIEHMYASEVDLNDDNVFDLMAAAQLYAFLHPASECAN
jgi:hypothetical protein